MSFRKSINRFLVDTGGTTATEYAVMLAMILLAIIIGLMAFGGGVSGWWTNIDTELNTHGF